MSSMEFKAFGDESLEDTLIYNSCWPFGNPGEEALLCGRLPGTYDNASLHYCHSQNLMSDTASRHTAQHASSSSSDWASGSYFNVDELPYAFNVPFPAADANFPNSHFVEYPWLPYHMGSSFMTETEFPCVAVSGYAMENPETDGESIPDSGDNWFPHTPHCADSTKVTNVTRDKDIRVRRSKAHGIVRQPSIRRFKPSAKKVTGCKGVTMHLRTLLRQLLAGSGWIMHSSISKDRATKLIKRLLGEDLAHIVQVELPSGSSSSKTPGWKDSHYNGILAEILTYILNRNVTEEETKTFITRDKGPYRMTSAFMDALKHRSWPPHLPDADELRAYGCYREGEGSDKSKVEAFY